MKKTKKLIVLVMSCVMLFGTTLTVQAYCPPHNWVNVSSFGSHCPQGHWMYVYHCYSCGGTEVRCELGHN